VSAEWVRFAEVEAVDEVGEGVDSVRARLLPAAQVREQASGQGGSSVPDQQV